MQAHATAAPEGAMDHHFHNSYWPFWIAVSVFFLYLGLLYPKVGLPIGVVILVVALGGWIRMDIANWRRAHQEEHNREEAGQPGGFWGMALFIGTEVMLFGALFGLWFVVRHHALAVSTWPPPGLPELPIVPTLINTAILVASGGTLHLGMIQLRKGNVRGYTLGLIATLVLGGIFLAGQVREYITLISEGLTIKTHVFGSIFFTLTGTHGFHVFGGLCFLLVVLVRSLVKSQTGRKHLALEAAAMYWHFVDVVWLFLVSVVYLQLI